MDGMACSDSVAIDIIYLKEMTPFFWPEVLDVLLILVPSICQFK